ncbi:FHA domain-containing protein [Bowdeniella nasicola]|uniref:FHA domain-containing protein n=1 Tax=Bowdeniella nasicola TaxID=208480 RepID=A0A1Q5Q3Q7_9ACTO|nr:FHA domain-containing protein [Bowdeniella nasicola]OKL54464.1 FHA domain-containing protein [Bowdeniella nasicola]
MSDTPRSEDPTSTARFGAVGASEDAVVEGGITADDKDVIAALPPASALLIVQRGPNRGARFLLDAETTTAGRHPASDIFLDDVTVSRKHCVFEQANQTFRIRDIGSLNGTYINRHRIDSTELYDGDEVQIGKYRMTFHASPHRESTGDQSQ